MATAAYVYEKYIDSIKSYIQLASVGLVAPLVLGKEVMALPKAPNGRIDPFSSHLLIFLAEATCVFFLAAIGLGLFYQYAAVKNVECEPMQAPLFLRQPGYFYGLAVVSFLMGAVFLVCFSMQILTILRDADALGIL